MVINDTKIKKPGKLPLSDWIKRERTGLFNYFRTFNRPIKISFPLISDSCHLFSQLPIFKKKYLKTFKKAKWQDKQEKEKEEKSPEKPEERDTPRDPQSPLPRESPNQPSEDWPEEEESKEFPHSYTMTPDLS